MADDEEQEPEPEPEAEAALELSFLSIDAVAKKTTTKNPNSTSSTSSWWKPTRYYAIAWIDPTTKQSTGAINPSNNRNHKRRRKLYFPIHTSTLESPQPPCVTIQILSHRRIPFQSGRLVGAAVLRLSDVKMSAQTFALPIRRESGEVRGTVTVSARVLWDLGFRVKTEVAVVEVSEGVEDSDVSESVGECERGTIGGFDSVLDGGSVVEPTAPPESVASTDEPLPVDDGEEGNFLVGLILGALVVLIVCAAGRRWSSKSGSPT